MNHTGIKRIISVVLIIGGIGLFFCANYISNEVAIGRGAIARGQSAVNNTNGLIDNTTRVQGLGNIFTGSAQDQINAGKGKANYYERLAGRIQLGGIALVIIGILSLIFSKKKWFGRF